jgi:hypothetical protein
MKTEKEKKRIKGPTKCQKCGQLGHRQSSYKCSYNGTKKMQVILLSGFYLVFTFLLTHYNVYLCYLFLLMSCRKRKPRKNSTKGWFHIEVSTLNRDANINTCQDTPTKPSTPKKRKKLTPKKKNIGVQND